jgi:hypothetical protein
MGKTIALVTPLNPRNGGMRLQILQIDRNQLVRHLFGYSHFWILFWSFLAYLSYPNHTSIVFHDLQIVFRILQQFLREP